MKYLTNSGLSYFLNKIKIYIASQLNSKASAIHTHTKSDITDLPNGYEVDSTLDGTSSNAIANSAVVDALDGKSNAGHTHTKSQITDFPNLSTVAISGSYNDLSNKPTTMTPKSHTHGNITNDGKIGSAANKPLITTTGGTVTTGSFGTSANTFCEGNDSRLSDARTPTAHTHVKSEITDFPSLSTVATSGSYSDLTNKPTIPTNTNQLTNGAGFITSSGSCNYANSAGSAGSVAWDNVSGKPSAFTPYFANGTWYAVGDDAAIGDHNICGGLGVKALNSTTTRIDLCYKDDASNYKSITYDGTTLYMDGNCNYANSTGNSDTLDGYHEYSFLRNRGGTSTSGEGTLWAQIGIKEYDGALPDGLSGIYNWGGVVSLAGTNSRFDIYCSHNSSNGNGLYYRSGWGDDKKDWRCFIDSANIGSQSVNYANSAGGVAWSNVSDRPWALSQFTNDSGYITTDGAAYPRRVGGVTMNFNWSGQGGQPTWLWGGEDGTNMYVYNPANFSVNYANSAGSAQPVFNNGQWYLVGDDVKIGDHNVGGGLGLLGNNANTRLDFCQYGNESNYKSITYDGTTLYMNGNCDYATNSNYTNWLRTSSHADHLFHTEWDGSYFWTYVTAGDGGYRGVRVERSNSSGWADSAGGVAWGNVSGRPWALSQFTNDSGFITGAVKESSYDNNSKYCLLYGNLLIQFGTNVFTAQSGSITFGKSFSSAPIVIVNYGDDVGYGSPCCVDEAYTTYFTVKQSTESAAWRCNWLAIGKS